MHGIRLYLTSQGHYLIRTDLFQRDRNQREQQHLNAAATRASTSGLSQKTSMVIQNGPAFFDLMRRATVRSSSMANLVNL